MADPILFLGLIAASFVCLALTSAALLRGWQNWLEVKRIELGGGDIDKRRPSEIQALRERVRRLEAIADGRA